MSRDYAGYLGGERQKQERLHLRAARHAVHLRAGDAALGGREGCRGESEHRPPDAEELAQAGTGGADGGWSVQEG